ncbi:MAG: hypothetical protein R3F31_05105 [Verrucomicrobiales bacterium]
MRENGTSDGFLGQVLLGTDAERPPAEEGNRGHLWISTDVPGTIHHSDGKEWKPQAKPLYAPMSLDVSVPSCGRSCWTV